MTSKTKLLRLQKFMAQCGVASRRKCEELIAGGKVAVNGKVQTKLGTSIDPRRDRVSVSGKPVRPVERGVLLLHKPIKVVSTMHDPEGRPTVAHYLSKHYRSYFPVGRLDFDSSGLVVMTNDGDLAERMLHPRYGSERVYIVEAQGSVPRRILETLSQGVKLEDGVVKRHFCRFRSERGEIE
ncbi:MAG: hypothetical protein DCC75_07505 [Proteobacteria bacterium]|nr:MAG: hypothetical protein DCC75_07505 [Pseudomonadota bacterium]